MNEYTYEECIIGKTERFGVIIKEEMLDSFCNLSGDFNSLHNDDEYAEKNGFDGRVTYGMLTASFLSTLAGMYLPGKYCLIQEVNLKFAKPVYIGDALTISGEVIERNDTFKQLVLKIRIVKENGIVVLRGKMKIGVMK